jgi:hypothetical protein
MNYRKTGPFTVILIILSLFLLLAIFQSCVKTTEKAVIKKPVNKKPSAVVVARLGINMLKSETLNSKKVKSITLKLYDRLLSIKGGEFIAFREHDESKIPVNHQLVGFVNTHGTGFSINVRVLSDLDGDTVYNRTSVVNEEIELDYILNDIAERVVENLW